MPPRWPRALPKASRSSASRLARRRNGRDVAFSGARPQQRRQRSLRTQILAFYLIGYNYLYAIY